jgi:type IV pilus assembly protein PilM
VLKGLFNNKDTQLVGLDIGTRFVKAIVLERKSSGYHVQALACEAIAGEAFHERNVHNFEAVSHALKKVKMALKVKIKHAAIAVSGPAVITKIVHMSENQTDLELENQVEIEAESLIPYPLNEVYMDFEAIQPSATHAGKLKVLLSAAPKELVDNRITLMREVSLEPKVIDIEAYALGKALQLFLADSDASEICCINIGDNLMQICVVEKDQVIYCKEHNFGTNNLLQDLNMMHGLSTEDALTQLIGDTLPDNWRIDTYPIFLSNLQQQMDRALQLYTSATGSQRPEKCLISGGGANIPELAKDLSTELNMQIAVFNPLDSMSISPQYQQQTNKIAPLMVIASGLAGRTFDPWHI